MRLLLVERARVAEEVTREIMNNSRAFAVWLLVSLNTCIEGMRVVNGGVRVKGGCCWWRVTHKLPRE